MEAMIRKFRGHGNSHTQRSPIAPCARDQCSAQNELSKGRIAIFPGSAAIGKGSSSGRQRCWSLIASNRNRWSEWESSVWHYYPAWCRNFPCRCCCLRRNRRWWKCRNPLRAMTRWLLGRSSCRPRFPCRSLSLRAHCSVPRLKSAKCRPLESRKLCCS